MSELLELPEPAEAAAEAALFGLQTDELADTNSFLFLQEIESKAAVHKKPYFKVYKVYKNETAIIKVAINDFKPFGTTLTKIKAACAAHCPSEPAFSIPADGQLSCGFLSRIKAMEHAKKGALKYINNLIEEQGEGCSALLKYRQEHYDDLNINLTDRNIRKLERARQAGVSQIAAGI